MKTRSMLLTMLLCVVGLTLAYGQSGHMGSWKLNEAKSKLIPGMMKNSLVTYTATGDMVKVTTDGVDGAGKPLHTEWTGKMDGKDYPLKGDPNADTRSYTKVDDRTLTLENKKAGKVTTSGKIVLSADGKSRTLTASGKTADGKMMTSVQVYDKQ
jgi:hypothetical protein